LLDEKAVRTTGVLVHKVDLGVRDGLMQELRAPSMSSRLRGIEMAVAMDATQDVSDQLIELTRCDSVTLRQEAVAALGSCIGPRVLSALRLATQDISQSVRDAAIASLKRLSNADDQASQEFALAAE
jgi:hypothetical protein